MANIQWSLNEIPAGTSRKGVKFDAFKVLDCSAPAPIDLVAKELGCPPEAVRTKYSATGVSYTVAKPRTPLKTGTFTF